MEASEENVKTEKTDADLMDLQTKARKLKRALELFMSAKPENIRLRYENLGKAIEAIDPDEMPD